MCRSYFDAGCISLLAPIESVKGIDLFMYDCRVHIGHSIISWASSYHVTVHATPCPDRNSCAICCSDPADSNAVAAMDSRPSSPAKRCQTAFPILMFKTGRTVYTLTVLPFLWSNWFFWIVSAHFLRLPSFHYKRLWYNTKDGIYFYPIIRLYAGQKPPGKYVSFLCFWSIPGYYTATLVGKRIYHSSPKAGFPVRFWTRVPYKNYRHMDMVLFMCLFSYKNAQPDVQQHVDHQKRHPLYYLAYLPLYILIFPLCIFSLSFLFHPLLYSFCIFIKRWFLHPDFFTLITQWKVSFETLLYSLLKVFRQDRFRSPIHTFPLILSFQCQIDPLSLALFQFLFL